MKKVDEVFVELINKMVEKHNVNYEYLIDNPLIDGQDWFSYFTWTQKEQEDYTEWAVNFLHKKKKWSKDFARKQMTWFMVAFGLRCVESQ